MRIAWTPTAASDLESISDYLFEENPTAAQQFVRRIYSSALTLSRFPNRGRTGRKDGTRELVVPDLPYLLVYKVEDETVRILTILHGSQRWP
jgi:toxin ParE1/3/4